MRRECQCVVPKEHPNPRKADSCVRCAGLINPAWTSNDRTLSAFLDGLHESIPAADPGCWEVFRRHVEEREYAGRDTFGHEFLRRLNIEEAMEEAVDLALYPYLDSLKVRRHTGEPDDEMAMVLTAAKKAFDAYVTLLELREKRRGAP